MSGTFSVLVQEARGLVAVPSDLSKLACVVGCRSGGTWTADVSPFFLSGSAAQAAIGVGDAVDTLCQIIEQPQPNGDVAKIPACFLTVDVTTAGSHGTIDVTGVTGTSVITYDGATTPLGTYDAYVIFLKDATVGTTGGTYQYSLDGGRSLSKINSLGTANSITIPNSGVKFDLGTGTVKKGDIVKVRTKAPQPAAADVTTQLQVLAAAPTDVGVLVCDFDCDASMITAISAGLSAMQNAGKRVLCLVKVRTPNAAESEAAWATAVQVIQSSVSDSRITLIDDYGLVTDVMSGRQYLRNSLQQKAADVCRVDNATWPDCPADRKIANYTLVDGNGNLVGHDEGPRGTVTGNSDDTQGNRLWSAQRLADSGRREDVFSTVPWVLYSDNERIRNIMTRRVANAAERAAVSAANSSLGGDVFYIPANPATGASAQLTEASRLALHGVVFAAVSQAVQGDVLNDRDASVDTGLVQINPYVTVSGGNLLSVQCTINLNVKGYIVSWTIVLAIKE